VEDLQLVGYTADLTHLVLSEVRGSARFRLPLDDAVLATVEEVIGLSPPGSPAFRAGALRKAELAQASPAPASPPPPPPPPPQPPGLRAGEGALAAAGMLAGRAAAAASAEPAEPATSLLSPKEIQALLRAGKAPKQVARLAETELAMIERWLPPIEAEREQVLIRVQQQRVTKSRLGSSRELLGEAVRRNLAAKGLSLEDDEVEWRVSRRDGLDVWSVELRYRSRGRSQRALWRYDPETDKLDPRNDLAVEIAWVRPRAGRGEVVGRGAVAENGAPMRRAAAERAPVKRAPVKRAPVKRAPVKRAPAKNAAAKRAPVKRAPAKQAAAKRGPAKRAPVKQAAAKKAPVKRAPARKAEAKKAPVKRMAKKAAVSRAAVRGRAAPNPRTGAPPAEA
jgi:hypothetical protein